MTTKINTLFAAIVIAGMSVNANAQSNEYYNTRHEFGIAVGTGATSEIVSGIADFTSIGLEAAISTVITGGLGTAYYTYGDESYTAYYTYGDESYIPTISAEYFYHVNKYVGLGGFVAFNGVSRDMYFTWKDNVNNSTHKELSGKAKRQNVSIIPAAKFDWLRMKYFGLYSKVGVGITIMHETQKDDKSGGTDYSDTTVIPNIQASLLGVEGGSETFRCFVEGGFGEQGILSASAGLRYKF